MNKPTIFFSHSSKDKEVLGRLKEIFSQKTGGTIDVFLSSDGQSIPLGRNWVHRVQEALEHSSVMVVFITPNSLRSTWIYFEAGFAYSKGIRVVPVGFLGSDLAHISPPLSLLQGFNIQNKDGLDNLIALVNEVYSHKHLTCFTAAEYDEIASFGDPASAHPLGQFLSLINEIHIFTNEREHLQVTADVGLQRAVEELTKSEIEFREVGNRIDAFGMTISTTDSQVPKPINFVLDPALIDRTLPLVIRILGNICTNGINGVTIRLDFADSINCISKNHKMTAKLFGTGVSLGVNDEMKFNDITFSISHLISFRRQGDFTRGATYLSIKPLKVDISVKELRELLELLFARKVLYEETEWVSIEN